MKSWWFTFGFGQGHDNCYVVIRAESQDKAREEMNRRWGNRWGFQYDSAEAAGVKEYNLIELKEEGQTVSKELEELIKLCDGFDKMITKSFMGVKIKVDFKLKGNDHYLCISQEMLQRIQKQREENDESKSRV